MFVLVLSTLRRAFSNKYSCNTLILLQKISPQKALGQLLKGELHLEEWYKAAKNWSGIATHSKHMDTFAIDFLDTEWILTVICSLQKPLAGVILWAAFSPIGSWFSLRFLRYW